MTKVGLYHPTTLKLLKQFDSIKEAAEFLKANQSNVANRVDGKTYKGYRIKKIE